MPGYTASTSTSFPQTSNNRTFDSWATELAEFSGGENRSDVIQKAESVIREVVKTFNRYMWTFNIVTEDLTLVASTADYDLSSNFRTPLRAQMVDSSGDTREHVDWVPWKEWVTALPDQSDTGSIPILYTARNIHQLGQVTVDPVPASSLTYPTLRLFYFRRIACPSGSSPFNVPEEVEQAMFDESVYRFLRKVRTFRESREALQDARVAFAEVSREYRDYEDYHGA